MIGPLSKLRSFFKRNKAITDNIIFRLHYRTTTLILLACCLIVSTKQFIADPINCYVTAKDAIPKEVLNSFCWIHSTFTFSTTSEKSTEKEILAPGIGIHEPDDAKIYHKYYQWVGLCLMLQAVSFYFPRYLWKVFERNKIQMLRLQLEMPVNINANANTDTQIDAIVDYFVQARRKHRCYAAGSFFCEFLAFVVVIVQIVATDAFLGGAFTKYGLRVISFSEKDQEDRHDPMILVFPRMTKCTYYQFGIGGSLDRHDALCVLPLNVVNEKIYIVLWFWFIILAVLTALLIVYRIPIFVSSHARKFMFARLECYTADINKLCKIIEEMDVGDWLLLKRLSQNIDGLHFKQLVDELYKSYVTQNIIRLDPEAKGFIVKSAKNRRGTK